MLRVPILHKATGRLLPKHKKCVSFVIKNVFLKPNIYTSFIKIYFSNAGAFLFSFVITDYKTSWKAKAVR